MAPARLLRRPLETSHSYITFGDARAEYPQFETGDEAVVVGERTILISTADAPIDVEVWHGDPEAATGAFTYDGVLLVEEGLIGIGTFLGANVERIPLPTGRYHVRVWADASGEATHLVIGCSDS